LGEEAAENPKILVIGDVVNDIVVRPEGPVIAGADRRAAIRMLPGGSGANQAAWLAFHGVRTIFAGRIGAADLARQSALLAAHGVEPVLAADAALPTGTIVTLVSPDGERSFLTDRGANRNLCRADLPDRLLDGVQFVHVSGYALFEALPRAAVLDLLAEAARRRIPYSVDPSSTSFIEEVGARKFLEWTGGARICFPNASEAALLAGTLDPDAQLDALTRVYDIVVIKRGAAGAMAGAADGPRWSVPARAVEAIDTTGAGDAFCGAFLAAWLGDRAVEPALCAGVHAGSRAVTILGGRPPVDPR
jgi:sugar/nucleoside kinase (ribokinase family)